MWKTLRILCLTLTLLTSCGVQSEVTVTTVGTPAKVPVWDDQSKLFPELQTTPTALPTTTTSTASTYAVASRILRSDVWDIIANCESGGDWSLDKAYDGGLQFSPPTWTAYVAAGKPYALVGYPAYAYQASRSQQIVVAMRVRDGIKDSADPYLNPQGWDAWPRCRHEAGV